MHVKFVRNIFEAQFFLKSAGHTIISYLVTLLADISRIILKSVSENLPVFYTGAYHLGNFERTPSRKDCFSNPSRGAKSIRFINIPSYEELTMLLTPVLKYLYFMLIHVSHFVIIYQV